MGEEEHAEHEQTEAGRQISQPIEPFHHAAPALHHFLTVLHGHPREMDYAFPSGAFGGGSDPLNWLAYSSRLELTVNEWPQQ